jgi:hypothetical protein
MIATALVLISLANVQETGTRIRDPNRPAEVSDAGRRGEEAEGRRAMHDYANCVVRSNRRGVESYLAVPPGTPEWARLGTRIATSDCLQGGQLRFQPSIFRGSLYEALYHVDYARRRPTDISQAPPIAYLTGAPATLTEAQRGWLGLQDFSDCVVRAKPAEARALLLSEVATASEGRALAAISPALGPCLVRGAEARFSRPILRGLIAESLYRLTAAVAGITR